MNTDFPENLFEPQPDLKGLYNYKLGIGEKISKDKTILFCGICRNVGDVLERNILRIHRTGQLFKEYNIFIYENDSTDNTVEILSRYASDNLKYLSENRSDKDYRQGIDSGEDKWHHNRCVVLSNCRNKYIEYANKNFSHYDYLCVIDLDLRGGWSYDGIKHGIFTINNENNIGCVSSYGVLSDYHNNYTLETVHQSQYLMYDSFAFRPWGLVGIHMLNTAKFNKLQFFRSEDPINVYSNFGGLAIYNMNIIKDKTYEARQHKDGFVDPDHVLINEKIIKDRYKIILDPSMIASYSNHKYTV